MASSVSSSLTPFRSKPRVPSGSGRVRGLGAPAGAALGPGGMVAPLSPPRGPGGRGRRQTVRRGGRGPRPSGTPSPRTSGGAPGPSPVPCARGAVGRSGRGPASSSPTRRGPDAGLGVGGPARGAVAGRIIETGGGTDEPRCRGWLVDRDF